MTKKIPNSGTHRHPARLRHASADVEQNFPAGCQAKVHNGL